MEDEIKEIQSAEEFAGKLKAVKRKMGKELLSDDDLFVLACEKIARTYTYEEKGYQ